LFTTGSTTCDDIGLIVFEYLVEVVFLGPLAA
jgi:hypothetical protein